MIRRTFVALVMVVSCPNLVDAAEILPAAGSYKRYLDEPAAFSYGVAVKVPVWRRISLRPELLIDNGKQYSNLVALGSIVGDFTDPARKAVGYWVASAGAVRTREERFAFNAWEGAVLGGAGVRFALSERWTAAVELRAGFPAFPLFTCNVGYRWGGKQ